MTQTSKRAAPPVEASASRRRFGAWGKDLLAGLVNGVVSIPDGLASAALAGVNPIHGLYTSVAAPIAGSLLLSAQRMQIATTSAAALAAGEAIRAYPADAQVGALFLLSILVGLSLVLFALLKVGRLIKYVSQSVMTGFLIGVVAVLIIDQLSPLAGYHPPPGSKPFQLISLLTNLDAVRWQSLLIGLFALGLAFFLGRTRWRTWSSVVALVLPSLLVFSLGWTSVELVSDVSVVSGGFPLPSLPDLSLLRADLVLAAVALAAIIAIQGAGVNQSITNLDGRPIDINRDILAQGASNIAAGIFSGIPAGGSVGQTALNVSVGAQTRWSGVFHGLWVLAILLFLAVPVGYVPMAVLAAIMIMAGISAINMGEARSIWAVGWPARIAAITTFAASLFFSITIAIAVGVILSFLMSLVRIANDVTIVEAKEGPDGLVTEAPSSEWIEDDDQVRVINVYGSLFFAGARTLAEQLPKPKGARRPIVILRLRGHSQVGATLIDVLDNYADELAKAGGKLYIAGLDGRVVATLSNASRLQDGNDPVLFRATTRVGKSTRNAIADAQAWLSRTPDRPVEDGSATR